ncbi:hypothetical protein ABEV54_20025 [Peribacillus psychrosaccharolyticus]|uniref:hypothetical protein n=1 Tax=Peribacillus psychrosaccharolyticus TaxID=1407 RepID=UPI003D2C3B83
MLSIDKVIEIHEGLLRVSDVPITIATEILWLIIGIVSLADIIKNRKSISSRGFIFRGFILGIILLIESILFINIAETDFSTSKEEWKSQYLIPYIKSLPEDKLYVKDFSQILEIQENKNKKIESIYLNNKKESVWVELSVIDKDKIKKKFVVQTVIRKEPIKKAYLTYKIINKTITPIYRDNLYYETILHIPEEYKILVPTK